MESGFLIDNPWFPAFLLISLVFFGLLCVHVCFYRIHRDDDIEEGLNVFNEDATGVTFEKFLEMREKVKKSDFKLIK